MVIFIGTGAGILLNQSKQNVSQTGNIPAVTPSITGKPEIIFTPSPTISPQNLVPKTTPPTDSSNKFKLDLQKIMPTIMAKFRRPNVTPVVPTIVIPTQPAVNFSCNPEGQEKISAYNRQIKQEYDVCKAEADAKLQQAGTCSGQCLTERSSGLVECTSKAVNQGADEAVCRSGVEEKFKSCSQNCWGNTAYDANRCTLSYQEKQKYVITLMSQYCGVK